MARLRRQSGEGGFTLVELLVASAMGVIVMGAVASLMISAGGDQPFDQMPDHLRMHHHLVLA